MSAASPDQVKTGVVVALRGGSGVVRTDDGETLPLVDDEGGSKTPGERVQFVQEDESYDKGGGQGEGTFAVAKLWNP